MNKHEKKSGRGEYFNRTICLAAGLLLCGTAVVYGMKKVEIASPASAMPKKEMPVIIIDCGHGGMDGGCCDADGVPEKGINLNIGLTLRDMLVTSGYTVEMTRETDTSIHDKGIEGIANQKSSDMDNRLELFNKYDNAVCISIHQNQFTDSKYKGAQMFYSLTNSDSERLAGILQENFKNYIQPYNDREIKQCGEELFLCYFSENPTVMVECGFMSNEEEAELLKTEEYQNKTAFTIYSSLVQYLDE